MKCIIFLLFRKKSEQLQSVSSCQLWMIFCGRTKIIQLSEFCWLLNVTTAVLSPALWMRPTLENSGFQPPFPMGTKRKDTIRETPVETKIKFVYLLCYRIKQHISVENLRQTREINQSRLQIFCFNLFV